MSMVTSCPACTTTFRVTPEELARRQGKVRCGRCRGVFDAFKSLATLADDPAAERMQPEEVGAAPLIPNAMSSISRSSGQALLDIAPLRTPSPLDDEEEAQPPAAPRRPLRVALLALAALALALVLQLAYVARDRLAAAWPATRPLLERLCAATGCSVAWPHRADLLAIEASDLQARPERPNVLILTATLRNRGELAVARPALELTLTNAQDQALARRILLPADYLPRATEADTPMAPLAEVDVRVEVDTADLKPAGYRLFLFYPSSF